MRVKIWTFDILGNSEAVVEEATKVINDWLEEEGAPLSSLTQTQAGSKVVITITYQENPTIVD